MAVWLTGPRRQWVVLGYFIPLRYSGTLNPLLFRLVFLLTLTLGSRNHIQPKSRIICNRSFQYYHVLLTLSFDILHSLVLDASRKTARMPHYGY